MSLNKSGFSSREGRLELETSICSVIKPPDKKKKPMCALTYKSSFDRTSLNTFMFIFRLLNVLPSL